MPKGIGYGAAAKAAKKGPKPSKVPRPDRPGMVPLKNSLKIKKGKN